MNHPVVRPRLLTSRPPLVDYQHVLRRILTYRTAQNRSICDTSFDDALETAQIPPTVRRLLSEYLFLVLRAGLYVKSLDESPDSVDAKVLPQSVEFDARQLQDVALPLVLEVIRCGSALRPDGFASLVSRLQGCGLLDDVGAVCPTPTADLAAIDMTQILDEFVRAQSAA